MNRNAHHRGQVRKPVQCRPNTRLTAVALALTVTFPVSAATLEWTGGTLETLDTFLATPENWSTNSPPVADDTLSFAELANDAYTLNNNLTTALHSLIFHGGSYTLTGGNLTLTPVNISGWGDPNILSVYGGSHSIDTASITLQPLVINRTISQEIFNRYDVNVSGGGVLNLNAPINIGTYTPITGLPFTGNLPAPVPAITASVANGSTLNLNGTVSNTTGTLNIINNGSAAISGVVNVSALTLSGTGQTTLHGNGAVTWGGSAKPVSLSEGARLVLDNSGTVLNDRLAGAAVAVKPGAILELVGNNSAGVTEQAGKLIINGVGRVNYPESVVRVSASGQSTVLSFSELAFGTDQEYVYNSKGRVDFQTNGSLGGDARILFTQSPASTDGLLNSATVNGNEFAAYDSTLSNGVARGVVAATTRNTLVDATSTDNVFLTGADETVTGAVTVNSLASHNTLLQGGQTVTVGSGQVLLNGANSIAPTLGFGAREGQVNIRSGQTILLGGLQGTAGAHVSGAGNLVISGVSSLTGTLRVDSPTLTLAADNVLVGSDINLKRAQQGDPAHATLDIGTTTQTIGSLHGYGGSVLGTGTIVATGAGGIHTSGDIAARLLASNGTVSLYGGTLSGDVSAQDVDLEFVDVTAAVSASNAIYVSYGTIKGNGVLNAPSINVVGGSLSLVYATSPLTTPIDRINDSAAVHLTNRELNITEQGQPFARTVEKIGALTISGSTSLNLSGPVGLLADSLTVTPGARLNVQLGAGTVKFVTSPVEVDGGVVDGVLVDRKVTTPTVMNGVVPVWATYTASNGLQTEHAVGTLASAGTGVVRVVANEPVNSVISVGGVVFDTDDPITGSGTLSTGKGMVFFRDNTVSITNVEMGGMSMLSNAGSNTIASNMSGYSLEKLGQGSIELNGTSTFNDVQVRQGRLVVTGTLNAHASQADGAKLVIKGQGRVNGDLSGVTLEQTSFTNANGRYVNNILVTQGSSLINQGTASNVFVSSGSVTNTGTVNGEVDIQGSGNVVTNHGQIQVDGYSTVYGYTDSIEITGGAKLINATEGSVSAGRVYNGGEISNAGTFELLAGGLYSGSGLYEQTAGVTTIDGSFRGDMMLKGGTLNGWGVITGTVTALEGAQILPGHSPGVMEIENIVLNNGSVLELDVSSAEGESDKLVIRGFLQAEQGSRVKFKIADATEAGTLDVRNYLTLANPSNADWSNISFLASTSTGELYALSVNADGMVGEVMAVPDAETYAMMLAGIGLIGARVRRQRKAVAA